MCSNTEPQQVPPAMTHHQQAIEPPERDCRHHEQVHRGNPISMVTKERPPSLRGRNPPPLHIFGHAGLADFDAKPQKLAMDPRCSPQRIGAAHLADKLAYFYRHGRSSAAVLRFPSPIRSKSPTVPTTVSGRTIASAPYILGNSRQTPPNINLSIETNRSLLGLARRSTLICCLSTRISASSATCDRNRSLAIPKISRHKSSIGYQHRAILSQLPARLNLRQGRGHQRRGIPFVLRRMRLSTTTSDELSARLFGRLRRRRQHQRIFENDDLTRAFSI